MSGKEPRYYQQGAISRTQRIVEKVDELMVFCDELETHLQTQSDAVTRFAAAIACIWKSS